MQTVYILKNYHATYVLFESAGFIYEYVNKSKKISKLRSKEKMTSQNNKRVSFMSKHAIKNINSSIRICF